MRQCFSEVIYRAFGNGDSQFYKSAFGEIFKVNYQFHLWHYFLMKHVSMGNSYFKSQMFQEPFLIRLAFVPFYPAFYCCGVRGHMEQFVLQVDKQSIEMHLCFCFLVKLNRFESMGTVFACPACVLN